MLGILIESTSGSWHPADQGYITLNQTLGKRLRSGKRLHAGDFDRKHIMLMALCRSRGSLVLSLKTTHKIPRAHIHQTT